MLECGVELVVFDLDGTLLDTAPDLIAAINHIAVEAGVSAVAESKLRPVVSFGGREMLRAALEPQGIGCDDAALDQYFARFVEYYSANISIKTQAFPGLIEALDTLQAADCKLAVCTNKLEGLTYPLLRDLELEHRFTAVTGRDSFPVCKPDPRHLLGTIARAGCDPTASVMVGDSITDLKTAKAAGVPFVGVSFGYSDVPMQELGPDVLISHYDQFGAALESLRSARTT